MNRSCLISVQTHCTKRVGGLHMSELISVKNKDDFVWGGGTVGKKSPSCMSNGPPPHQLRMWDSLFACL